MQAFFFDVRRDGEPWDDGEEPVELPSSLQARQEALRFAFEFGAMRPPERDLQVRVRLEGQAIALVRVRVDQDGADANEGSGQSLM
jgi:hypothetical protein